MFILDFNVNWSRPYGRASTHFSIEDAFKAINLDVIIFPFEMFSIVSALNRSGMLMYIAGKMLDMANSAHNYSRWIIFLCSTNPDISPNDGQFN